MFKEFKEFAMRGSVIDLAVGIIIGVAFGNVVNALVDDLIMPPIGLLLAGVNFNDLFIPLAGGEYASLEEAQAAGAPVLAYGHFISTVITFLIVAFVVFLLVRTINRLRSGMSAEEATEQPTTKECPFCFSTISIKATRCPECTSNLVHTETKPSVTV